MINEKLFRQRIEMCWPASQEPILSEQEKQFYCDKIKHLLKEKSAVLIAHYYTGAEIQKLADETGGFVGDSLEMAKFGKQHPADMLIIAGVSFMGETAKILSPNKRILMPTLAATCSLDIGCDPKEFQEFCAQHPNRTIVVYANTSAAIKALADWIVTSSIAVKVVDYLAAQGKKIIWAPDRYLGNYIQKQTGADMLVWEASCVIHEQFAADMIKQLREQHPDAAILAHPESPPEVIELADVVGSTSQLLKASAEFPNPEFIVATEPGILYKMQLASPQKTFIPAPTTKNNVSAICRSCAFCPWMKMNTLKNIAQVLENEDNEIIIDEKIRERALLPLERMINFK